MKFSSIINFYWFLGLAVLYNTFICFILHAWRFKYHFKAFIWPIQDSQRNCTVLRSFWRMARVILFIIIKWLLFKFYFMIINPLLLIFYHKNNFFFLESCRKQIILIHQDPNTTNMKYLLVYHLYPTCQDYLLNHMRKLPWNMIVRKTN